MGKCISSKYEMLNVLIPQSISLSLPCASWLLHGLVPPLSPDVAGACSRGGIWGARGGVHLLPPDRSCFVQADSLSQVSVIPGTAPATTAWTDIVGLPNLGLFLSREDVGLIHGEPLYTPKYGVG